MSNDAILILVVLMLCAAIQMAWLHNTSAQRMKPANRFGRQPNIKTTSSVKHQRKPDWIRQDVLRLKAMLPQSAGVRQIAATFNRIQAAKSSAIQANPWRVSKSYVANLLRDQQLEVLRIRSEIRQRQPGISAIRQTWGIDLTGKTDISGALHHIFGIIDHGSRRLLALIVSKKHSARLASHIKQACSIYGRPKRIRTDNEHCFTSTVFQTFIHSQGIRLQTTELHCPWQNGRIERLFGTLKQQLDRIQIESAEHLQTLLDEFKHWYNTIRLHQHLGYQTPQEVWQKQTDAKTSTPSSSGNPQWWTGWGGQLRGVQCRN
jgi:putative transposase